MAKRKNIKVIETPDVAKLQRIIEAQKALISQLYDDLDRHSYEDDDLPAELVELEKALDEAENS